MSDDEDIPEYYTPLQKELLKMCRKVSPTVKEVFLEFSKKLTALEKDDGTALARTVNSMFNTHAKSATGINIEYTMETGEQPMNHDVQEQKEQFNKLLRVAMATEIANRMNAKVQAEELLQRYNTRFTVDCTRIDPCGYDFEVHAYVENVPTMTTTVQIRPEKKQCGK